MRAKALVGPELSDLLAKIDSGERLGRRDFVRLWDTSDLTGLGALANFARERAAGNRTMYRYRLHLDCTGHPPALCPDCGAQRWSSGPAAATEGPFDAAARQPLPKGCEIHLSGGLGTGRRVEDLLALVYRARKLGSRSHLRAFSWTELRSAAEKDGQEPAAVLHALVEAGIESLTGGILADLTEDAPHTGQAAVREMEQFIPWIRAASEVGLKCEFTWITGNADDPEVLADLLICVRGIQDRWKIFECCVPLLFQSHSRGRAVPMPTGYNQLRAIAAARLFLDNFPHIQSPIAEVGESVAQAAQWYGADDIGGIPIPEQSGEAHPGIQRTSTGDAIELMRSAGRDPVDLYAGAS
jgi:aminodeoxyfutalosine synthase